MEDGAWTLVAEAWAFDLLCHLSSVTLSNSLNFPGTLSSLLKMMYLNSFIHSFIRASGARLHSQVTEIKVWFLLKHNVQWECQGCHTGHCAPSFPLGVLCREPSSSGQPGARLSDAHSGSCSLLERGGPWVPAPPEALGNLLSPKEPRMQS